MNRREFFGKAAKTACVTTGVVAVAGNAAASNSEETETLSGGDGRTNDLHPGQLVKLARWRDLPDGESFYVYSGGVILWMVKIVFPNGFNSLINMSKNLTSIEPNYQRFSEVVFTKCTTEDDPVGVYMGDIIHSYNEFRPLVYKFDGTPFVLEDPTNSVWTAGVGHKPPRLG
jgi:hypothetical protein